MITPEMLIADVVERYPGIDRIFAKHGTSCAGCNISKHETIAQGAGGHGRAIGMNFDALMADLNAFAQTGKYPAGTPEVAPKGGAAGLKNTMGAQAGVRHVIAVMSGKGGVGKSLVAGLLAVGLKRRGFAVGILDGDITGPSIPRMFGVRAKPGVHGQRLVPPTSAGAIPIISMNLLLPAEDEAVIWRGPMVSGAIRQFFTDVEWGVLDYLIVDLPPGTSDAPLTVMQALPVSGTVIVTTPQALATMVVTKAVRLVKQLGGDVLGCVENMAYVEMPESRERIEVFGPSQGLKLVIASGAPLIGRIPIDPLIAQKADSGTIETYESPQFDELVQNFIAAAPLKVPGKAA
jgi:hybrid cluster-associated redox disulfide protein